MLSLLVNTLSTLSCGLVSRYRDGTGQDFLDPTGKSQNLHDRPVNRFLTGPVDRFFLHKAFVHCSMHLMKKFQKGAHW